nr:prepilin-type N-terminal cleavage/methylation domain-containing protein [uncultured Desulfobulbus sp.]
MTAKGQDGYTLLELLVVVAILAAISFIASGTFKGVAEHADERLAYSEMQQIASALRQFKADTGYFPREGVFRLTADGGEVTTVPSHDDGSDDEWFYSPANLYQLLATTSPLPATHPLATWNAETGRGWRGPYLSGFADGEVNIGDDLNPTDPDLADNDSGDPTAGTMVDVVGIADPFDHKPIGSIFQWSNIPSGDAWGRPYLFLQTAASPNRWQLVSMGPDGAYNTGDDIVLPVQ